MKWLFVALCFLAGPVLAVQPGEMLDNPALEARARELSSRLRCLVCRNESIDESNADLARDLRILVRERLSTGDSDDEVMDFLVDRYGEYILLRPDVRGVNLALWLAGPAMLIFGGGIALGFVLRRGKTVADRATLTPEETARLRQLTEPDGEQSTTR